jgi:hypothetical protein
MADYLPKTVSRGLLRGICPTCETLIHRAVTLGTVDEKAAGLNITRPRA